MPGSLVIGLSAVSITLMFCYYYQSPALHCPTITRLLQLTHDSIVRGEPGFHSIFTKCITFAIFSSCSNYSLHITQQAFTSCISNCFMKCQISIYIVRIHPRPYLLNNHASHISSLSPGYLGSCNLRSTLFRDLTYILTFLDFLEK